MIDGTKLATPSIEHYTGSNTSSMMQTHHSQSSSKTTETVDVQAEVQKSDIDSKVDKLEQKHIDELNQMSKSMDVDIKFAYNDKIDTMYVSVIDKNSGEVIRKLPTEDAMKLKETMKEFIGSLFDKKG